ncbi:glyoxylase-like metal-dependent hydrolase (beta-lactamase superfamily II) [Nocardioides luteus]|uniref:MBL fold metallo-hydrolase n=1 Tax=Nocardioides luteus TaxID=1844 RepID=A0ABQ5SUW2_9ACTN|nr:MBL fold metallo-hydrolase [Nocardioides luteus]MDR7311204.1 glyoxylase-like metal-dependent hydrolase (beta-lactamase superfamily II) [Nocardioides luteus]GGR63009.1 MBL fold metallo-hydrolase [Nocardioides luteus]GLJ66751.1 MBL fold metallo-hydrolase [Nocardioides luteus]
MSSGPRVQDEASHLTCAVDAMWDVGGAPPRPGEPVEVTAGVHLLLAPNANHWTYEGTNTWILVGEGRAVVIDPGPTDPGHLDRIDEVVRSAGARVETVLLSHHHGDHSQAAGAVAERWRAPIRPRVQKGLIPDGTRFDLGRRTEIRTLTTPGHTSDGVSFALGGRRVMLTGDTVLARFNPYISHPDGTIADMLGSMARIADLVDDDWTLLPGHGPAVREPTTYLHARIADRRRRIDQVAGLLADGVAREHVTDHVYAKVDDQRLPAARASVEAILHFLDTRGPAQREKGSTV